MKRFVVIDGKSVFYRGYYAMPSLTTQDGIPTGGVFGFTAMALEVVRKLKPTHVCVAWDKPGTNIRSRLALYPEYKAGRKKPPEDFYAQIPILMDLLKSLNWPLYEFDDYEADDIMHTLAVKSKSQDIECLLITSDLDSLQSLNSHTKVYLLKKGLTNIEPLETKTFEEKYGIKISQFLDLKSLKGDSSDNIPGVPGIGEKTATDLLQKYKTLDGIYEHIGLLKASVAKKLVDGKDSAYLSKKIAVLYDTAPVDIELEHTDIKNIDIARLKSNLRKLEFNSLLRVADQIWPKDNAVMPQSEKPIFEIVDKLDLKESVVAYRGGDNDYILNNLGESKYYKTTDLERFDFSNVKNFITYDYKNFYKHSGSELRSKLTNCKVADILLMAFHGSSTTRDFSVQGLAGLHINLEIDDSIEQFLFALNKLYEFLDKKYSKIFEEQSYKVDIGVSEVLARIEDYGIKINRKYFEILGDSTGDEIKKIEKIIYKDAGKEFNISSTQQLGDILFEDLKLPLQFTKKGKNGHYSTAADVLEKLKNLHPIVEHITNYREMTKLKSTYIDVMPKVADQNDRVHGTFNLTIAATGRLSSTEPNLQNIPVRTESGRKIRSGFIVEKGNTMISADYSQFELRIAAAMCGDQLMIDAFNKNEDIHTQTAALINSVDVNDVTKEMRYSAKAINFGVLYGQGTFGLSQTAGIPLDDAKDFIKKYFEVRPKLRALIEKIRNDARDLGYVETLLGRRRPTPDVKSNNFIVREAALRAAVNMPIQGTAADLTKKAMVELDQIFKQKYDSKPKQILQVHDSIMVECPESITEDVLKDIKNTMENIYPKLGIKLNVDVKSGANWGEL